MSPLWVHLYRLRCRKRLFSTSCNSLYPLSEFSKKEINKNACGIQHLSNDLHKQIFPVKSLSGPTKQLIDISLKYLEQNELLGKPCSESNPINFKLPLLQGNNINHHFQNLGLNSAQNYSNLVDSLCKIGNTPLLKPNNWLFKSGWTRYTTNEDPKSVPYPLEDELVFDCEVMYKTSPYPVMATCLSPKAWYSWCSPYLTGDSKTNNHLIPLATDKRDCVIVGHNVSFDRARVLEEYDMDVSKAFFLDTMSLHVSVSGMCSRQRGTWLHYKNSVKNKLKDQEKSLDELRNLIQNDDLKYTMSNMVLDEESLSDDNDLNSALREDPWMKSSSMNSLADVADFYCGIKMEKQLRDHFASTDVKEIRDLFQDLMNYCADDVIATYHVLHKVYPMFRKVVPHPVSFAALRHINSSFLPTSTDWEDYIHRCENMYQKSKDEVEDKIHLICEDVVNLRSKLTDKIIPWKDDPWLSQLDWTIKPIKMTKNGTPYKNQKLPGYPEWYKKLVVKDELKLTIKTRSSPLLLNMLWENKPIFWTNHKGWCFIVDNHEKEKFNEMKYINIDPTELLKMEAPSSSTSKNKKAKTKKVEDDYLDKDEELEEVAKEKEEEAAEEEVKEKSNKKAKKTKKASTGKKTSKSTKPKKTTKSSKKNIKDEHVVIDTPEEDFSEYAESDALIRANLEKLKLEGKTLYKIPHENGADARVTSLISKPFLRYYEEGILSSSNKLAKEAFEMNVTNSYWVSSRERIMNQFVVYESTLKSQGSKSKNKKSNTKNLKELGFIIPQIIPMGTITRRAVEKTWLTASNAKKTRLGSELKSLIQAPPGYVFVGADVDSEELWIASLVGDSAFRLHGGTALGWMTLEGTKNAGTDLHSKTAKILGISRNEAKVFNYGRIYGAGVKFATSLLAKFNPTISEEMATKVAKTLYSETKGKSGVIKLPYDTNENVRLWYGGSESVVFNMLESIAEQDNPKTPVLGAGITAALNRQNLRSNSFLPSRINWAIQSSGVDYLHLLLISMEHLCKIYGVDARLAITVHDEVRYITKEENKYKCAMLLQIANLWVRAMFCYQLGIENIPQSCAFFSCVDIDFVLRKEVDFDCITPSNSNPIPHGESIDIVKLLDKEEVQVMLKSLNDKLELNINFDPKIKISRPVEEINKKMDMSTKLRWLDLQICKTDTEFKKKKKDFFNSANHSKLESFSKTLLKEDVKTDEVACDGLFESEYNHNLLDAGTVLENNWEALVEKPKKQKPRIKKTSITLEEENPISQYIDMLGENAVNATLKENKTKSRTSKNSIPNTSAKNSKTKPKSVLKTTTTKTTMPVDLPIQSVPITKSNTKTTSTLKTKNTNTAATTKRAYEVSPPIHHHSHLTESEIMEVHNC